MEIFLEIIKIRIIILLLLNIEYKYVSILIGFIKFFIVNDVYKISVFIFVDVMILLGYYLLKDEIINWLNLFCRILVVVFIFLLFGGSVFGYV